MRSAVAEELEASFFQRRVDARNAIAFFVPATHQHLPFEARLVIERRERVTHPSQVPGAQVQHRPGDGVAQCGVHR